MRVNTFCCVVLLASASRVTVAAQTAPGPAPPGVHAETDAGSVPLEKTLRGLEIAAPMRGTVGRRAFVFPIPNLDDVPVAIGIAGFLVNLATVNDQAAAAAQMRLMVGDHIREPDYQPMTVRVGKFRTGLYRISSPNLTTEWLSTAYAKLTSKRKYNNTHPPAIVGLILNEQVMYPVRIDETALTAKR